VKGIGHTQVILQGSVRFFPDAEEVDSAADLLAPLAVVLGVRGNAAYGLVGFFGRQCLRGVSMGTLLATTYVFQDARGSIASGPVVVMRNAGFVVCGFSF